MYITRSYIESLPKSYLDYELPNSLVESIEHFLDGQEKLERGEKYLLYDCDYCELQSEINYCEVENLISSEQAWYLRGKYLGLERTSEI
jgi:hypothetical protein